MRMPLSLIFGLGLATLTSAQTPNPTFVDPLKSAPLARPAIAPDVAPTYRFALTAQSGDYLIVVQSFRHDDDVPAQRIAVEFAEILRTDYKLPAYIYDWGWKERQAQNAYVAEQKRKWEEFVKDRKGETIGEPRIKRVHIPDHFAVVIGSFKDIESASKYLETVRKLKLPPEKYMHKSISEKGYSPLNPFLSAFAGPNPLVPRKAVASEDGGLDKFSRKLNESEEYSLLSARKPWTLVVKNFRGLTALGGGRDEAASKSTFGKNEGYLNASAGQAHEVARMLRAMKYDAYVLHMPQYSLLTVGNFNSADDPQLQALAKTLAGLKLFKDIKANHVFMELNRQPQAMEIPR